MPMTHGQGQARSLLTAGCPAFRHLRQLQHKACDHDKRLCAHARVHIEKCNSSTAIWICSTLFKQAHWDANQLMSAHAAQVWAMAVAIGSAALASVLLLRSTAAGDLVMRSRQRCVHT